MKNQATMVVSWTFLVVIASCILLTRCDSTSQHSEVHMDASTNSIDVGFTKDMSLNCSYVTGSDIGGVVSLTMYKTNTTDDSDNNYREVAHIISFSPSTVDISDSLEGHVKGYLDNQGTSFISYQWSYPSTETVGKYKCEAIALDMMGRPRYTINTTSLELGRTASTPKLLVMLREYEKSQAIQDSKIKEILPQLYTALDENLQCQDVKTRLNASKAAFVALEAKLNTSHAQIKQYEITEKDLEARLNSSERTLKDLSAKLYTSQTEHASCESMKQNQTLEIASLKTQISLFEDGKKQCEASKESLRNQLLLFEAGRKVCEATLANQTAQIDNLTAQLKFYAQLVPHTK